MKSILVLLFIALCISISVFANPPASLNDIQKMIAQKAFENQNIDPSCKKQIVNLLTTHIFSPGNVVSNLSLQDGRKIVRFEGSKDNMEIEMRCFTPEEKAIIEDHYFRYYLHVISTRQ
jgi:hypothetical protein